MRLLVQINYAWRLFATGLSFSVFGLGSLVLAYITIPMIKLFSNEDQLKYRVQHTISINFRLFVLLMQVTGLSRFSVIGKEKLLADRGSLFIANHPSLIDYVVITSQLKYCDNIVKESLWQNFFVRQVVQAADYIAHSQSQETLDKIKSSLDKGNNLLLFPEGTRSVVGQPIQIKRGAAQIAIRLNVPIRLIYITCHPRTLTKELKWYQIPDRRVDFTVTIGESIQPSEFLEQSDQLPSLAARKLTQYLEKKLTEGSHL